MSRHSDDNANLPTSLSAQHDAAPQNVLVHFLFQPKTKDEIILTDQLKREIGRKTIEEDVAPEDIRFFQWDVSHSMVPATIYSLGGAQD